MSIRNLPLRQKSFVLGAATLGALAASGADAQLYSSATYTSSPGSAAVTGNANVTSSGVVISNTITAHETGTSGAVAVTNLPMFNPASYSSGNPTFTHPDLIGVTLSLHGSMSFTQIGSTNTGVIGYVSASLYASPFSGTLMLTQPNVSTISTGVPAGTPTTVTSYLSFLSARTLSLDYTSGAAAGQSSVTGGGIVPFIGTGNVPNVSLSAADNSTTNLHVLAIGLVPSYSLNNYLAESTGTTVSVTYNFAYLASVPGPSSLAVFGPSMFASLGLLSRRRRRGAAA